MLFGKSTRQPPTGHARRDFLVNPAEYVVNSTARYGRFFRIPFFFRNIYITTDLEAIRHVLQVNHKNYVKSPAYRQLQLALGQGLLTSEGEFWRRQRRLAQPVFYKKALVQIYETMVQEAELFLAQWQAAIGTAPEQDISQRMMEATANIVMKTLFSSSTNTDQETLYRLMNEAQDYVIHRTLNPHLIPLAYLNGRHRAFLKSKTLFDQLVYGMIADRRAETERPHDLLSLLLGATDADSGSRMDDLQLRDELITLFAAGHETSANALAWTLWLLAEHPQVQEQAAAEALRVLNQGMPDLEGLSALTYIMQVIQEGMRLYPPAHAVGREAQDKDTILGYSIARKSILFVSIYALHRDPEYWERPHAFYPEHFADEAVKARPRLAYMPFGAGPRMCIGNHFALMEMQLLLALLLQRFRFSATGQQPELHPLVTLKPKAPIQLNVEVRR